MKKQIEILLNYPFLYKWQKKSSISIITNSDADIYFNLFKPIKNEQEAFQLLKNTDGNFAVVIDDDNYFLAAVDRVRSFPLLYKITEHKIFVTDNIEGCEKEFIFNEAAINTFKKIYCTEDDQTLLKSWKQLQPSEFIFINKLSGDFSIKRYFVFRDTEVNNHISATSLKKLYLDVFKFILDKIGDRPIIVPLSGGYDSRCIVAILTELKVNNFFVYTYGRKDSSEKKIAEKVARQLNLNWHFIEYTDDLLDAFFSKNWKNYFLKNHHFTSLPMEQEFFGLHYLRQNNLLPRNGVVLSGFLGDGFGGSIFKSGMEGINKGNYQDHFFTNRCGKFIVNGVRLYEYFELEWYMPFLASSLIDFWFGVPLEQRRFKNGFNDFLSEVFFKPLHIDFKKKDHYYQTNHFKKLLKKYLPNKIVKLIQSKNLSNNINDPNNTNYLKKKLAATFSDTDKKKVTGFDFNEVYAKYFLKYLKEKISLLNEEK